MTTDPTSASADALETAAETTGETTDQRSPDKPRTVAGVIPAFETHEGEGFLVHRPFPQPGLDLLDPFLLLDQMGPTTYAPGKALGTPEHPHKGFETVTYVLEGALEHRDSTGGGGVISAGDVQWMTAGRGIVHIEQPTDEIKANGGTVHGFQLWVNLRAADKLTPAKYQGITKDEIAVVERDGATVRVIAGEFEGAVGPIVAKSPMSYFHVTLAPGARIDVPVTNEHTAFAYVFGGSASGGSGADEPVADNFSMIVWWPEGNELSLVGGPEGAEVLLLTGEPLREPVARYGPFVMNTREEIIEAFTEFENGTLGAIAPR